MKLLGINGCNLRWARKTLAIGSAVVLLCLNAHAAKLVPGEPTECGIRFSGPIDAQTPGALEAAIQKTKAGPCKRLDDKYRQIVGDKAPASLPLVSVVLQIVDSPGGDLVAAMQAGRILRRELVDTIIPIEGRCASACVFMYLGGIHRSSNVGMLGLHRPYSTRGSQSMAESQAKLNRMAELTKAYVAEMNISLRFLDIVNSVPPNEIRWLRGTKNDAALKKELLVDGVDPAYLEMRDAENARIWGISRAEFYARRERSEEACFNVEGSVPHFQCYVKIMSGKQ